MKSRLEDFCKLKVVAFPLSLSRLKIVFCEKVGNKIVNTISSHADLIVKRVDIIFCMLTKYILHFETENDTRIKLG